MKAYSFILVLTAFLSSFAFAGGSLGGGGAGKELQEIALSETTLSATRMAEILGDTLKLNLGTLPKNIRTTRLVESSTVAPAGILLEVQPTDFDLVTASAAEGKEFIYRDLTVRATGMDPESRIVTMTLVDDPSVTIVVKDAESN
ncbi:MAG: hypothetical protein M3Q07_13985 [Pseudobdellovibrionaceae bacterium]|nr:hypothetical protein [Pseudobdellovibrionaceae bacterium]